MALLASVFLPLLLVFHLVGPLPADLGVHGGQLSPCPSPQHCAQAFWASDQSQFDFDRLSAAVASLPGALIIENEGGYLHAEVSSAFFGFVDDLELHVDESSIQARSISRLGDSDLGVNGQRLAALKASLS